MRRPKIFIVDDEPDIRQLVFDTLKTEPVEILSASRGEGLLERLKRERPAIVILDVNLGDRDGLALLGEIRQQISRQLPVIIISGQSTETHRLRAEQSLASIYLAKPFSPGQLKAAIIRFLSTRRTPGADDRRHEPAPPTLRPARFGEQVGRIDAERCGKLKRHAGQFACGHGPYDDGFRFQSTAEAVSVVDRDNRQVLTTLYVDPMTYDVRLKSGKLDMHAAIHLWNLVFAGLE